MSAIKLSTPSSGSISLSPANTASNLTITVPAVTGTMLTTASTFAGTGPTFSAYNSSTQTLTNVVLTLVAHSSELFDTASCFNNTGSTVGGIPAYAFLPNVAGYYQVVAAVRDNTGVAGGQLASQIYKNAVQANSNIGTASSQGLSSTVNTLIYLNGSTDYIQHYALQNSGGNMAIGSQQLVYFQAVLVRAA